MSVQILNDTRYHEVPAAVALWKVSSVMVLSFKNEIDSRRCLGRR